MKALFTALVLLLTPQFAIAQNPTFPPVDEALKDPTLVAFRNALLAAVETRDTEAVVALSSPNIHLSFGGDTGHDSLRNFLNVPIENLSEDYKSQAPEMRDNIWNGLKDTLKLGGRFEDGIFIAPHMFTADIPADAEAYETHFVTGTQVLMRSAPQKTAPILRRLSYNIVYSDDWNPDGTYQAIRLPDGTKGYVAKQYLRPLVDYRIFIARQNGAWKMTTYITGD